MGSRAMRVYQALATLPISPQRKFKMIQMLRNAAFVLKSAKGAPRQQAALIMSNEGYGHDYWLKKYSGFTEDIAAQIEHGVYFGGNTSPGVNPIAEEQEIGAFITYGPYRKEHLSHAYPDHAVAMIGPYIQYAETDQEYFASLKEAIDDSKKTLTLFPSHSVRDGRAHFNHAELVNSTKSFAEKSEYGNLLVCLSPMDYTSALADFYREEGFVVASCGEDGIRFLPRQRAIIGVSDLTVSNDIGTHIGYSLAMEVPHLLINPISVEEKIKGNCIAPGANLGLFREERAEIVGAFSDYDYSAATSELQEKIYDYYWGGSIKLSPAELRATIEGLNHSKSAVPKER